MATIKPFKGLRPPKELVERVESRPYDVLDSEEARAEAGDNEMSLYHIIKPEIDFEPGTSEYDPRVYERAAENFQKFQDKGWLVQDKEDHYYIYAQSMNGKTQYGLVVGAYVDDYIKGHIKKHELTRRDKEEDRMKHVRVNNANIEPVFFAYPDNDVLDRLIMRYAETEPEYDFIAPIDGFRHQFWVISDPTTSMSSLRSLPKCLHFTSPTVITAKPQPLLLAPRNKSKIPTIKATRNIIISWRCVSRPHNSPFLTTTVW